MPYLYVAIEVTDSTVYERTEAYTSRPDPWINDGVELYYRFGGGSAPDMSTERTPYPRYNGLVRGSTTGSNLAPLGSGEYLEPTAVTAEKSVYFNLVECAVLGREFSTDNTYVIEYKIPAMTESYTGTPTVGGNFTRTPGVRLGTGDFVFFAYQLNDLTGLPAGYTTTEQYDAKIATFGNAQKFPNEFTYVCAQNSPWRAFEEAVSPYVYSAGNSRPEYLEHTANGAAPMAMILSGELAE